MTSEACLLCTWPWEELRDWAPLSEWRAGLGHLEGWQEVACGRPAMGAQLAVLFLSVLSFSKLTSCLERRLTAQAHRAPTFPDCGVDMGGDRQVEGLCPG